MNFVKCNSFVVRISKVHIFIVLFSAIIFSFYLVGCSDDVIMPSTGQLAEFESAGPLLPSVDMDRLVKANISGGPYHVVNGDVLQLTMPGILQVTTTDESVNTEKATPYICRVSDTGSITIPIVGEIEVAGKSLGQIEKIVINSYYPAYTVKHPSVFARVLEYKTAKVSITGAVNKPGIYSLRHDQMSLVALLMEAGGIVDGGAAVIRVAHRDHVAPNNEETGIETAEEMHEQPFGLSKTKLLKFTSRYPGSNEIKIQLYFQQEAPSSTIGRLTIRHDEKRLLTEQIDLADKGERLLLLDKLARIEPLVSIVDVEQKLSELVKSLKARLGNLNRGSESADSNIKLSSLRTVSLALSENLSQTEYLLPSNNLEQKLSPQAKRKWLEYRQSKLDSQNKTANENLSPEFSTNLAGQNSITNDILGEKLIEITNLDRKLISNRIAHSGTHQESDTLVLPVKGLNIPFTDVVLYDGDSVIVEPLQMPVFTVIGLVTSPGSFPYPSGVQYNLLQAIGLAGGLDQNLEPRYAMVYRLKPDGTIVHAAFQVAHGSKPGSKPPDALTTRIKHGDIIAVEHTPRTRTNRFLENIFSIHVGAYVPVWNNR